MIKYLFSACLVSLVSFYSFALGIDVNELNTGKKIEFINYTGPSKRYTVSEIKGWGAKLASDLSGGARTGRFENQFVVIHAVDQNEKGKYDAEIISLTRFCTALHIDTIRLVIAGFLEAQYGYSARDAATLSVFATYYNAVYRGDIAYFGEKYKEIVMGNINQRNAGIATEYRQWAGATNMLIPLSEDAKKGEIGSLDMSSLTDKKVIDTMRKEEDRSIEKREDMVDLKEREIKEDREDLDKEKTELEKDKAELDKDKEKLEKEKAELEKEKEDAKKITDEKERELKEKEIAEKEKEIAEKEKDIASKTGETETSEKDIAKKETEIAKKEDEIKTEKENLEKDKFVIETKKDPDKKIEELFEREKELDKREDALLDKDTGSKKIYAGKFYYLRVKEYLTGGHYNNDMYILDAPTLTVVTAATMRNICGKLFDVRSNGVVVITHTGNHVGGHYLSLLNLDTLEEITTGKTTVFHRSFVEIRDNYIYAIVVENDDYFLGKFDSSTLELIARSKDEVDADTLLSFYKENLYVNNFEKKILVLNGSTLETVNVFTP